MKGHGSKFGRKKEQAIVALLTRRNIDEAAKSIGVVANTLLRWMKEPEFDTSYRAARRKAFKQAVARLQQGSTAAATTLLKTLVEPGTPPSVRVRAAECILNHATKAIEIEDMEARVAELERAYGASNSQGGGSSDGWQKFNSTPRQTRSRRDPKRSSASNPNRIRRTGRTADARKRLGLRRIEFQRFFVRLRRVAMPPSCRHRPALVGVSPRQILSAFNIIQYISAFYAAAR
jgi:hypothetical protein